MNTKYFTCILVLHSNISCWKRC